MSVPDFQSFMLPLLSSLSDGQVRKLGDLAARMADHFDLTPEDRAEPLPSGRKLTYYDRAGWAATYMMKAGLLQRPKRGYYEIADRGRDVLASPPPKITVSFLEQYPEFVKFRERSGKPTRSQSVTESEDLKTPEETFEQGYEQLRSELAAEILQTIQNGTPAFFERLVVDVLVKMGYGGTRRDAGRAIGGSSDGGIDGIINEDRLGLDVIYIQAKKWDGNTIGRPEIQKFAGALQGRRARKGIFITTSSFTSGAREYVASIDSKIILIDGEQLTQYMIDFDVGVAPVATYHLKRLDSDYFEEE